MAIKFNARRTEIFRYAGLGAQLPPAPNLLEASILKRSRVWDSVLALSDARSITRVLAFECRCAHLRIDFFRLPNTTL
jgi:hypothetical protein